MTFSMGEWTVKDLLECEKLGEWGTGERREGGRERRKWLGEREKDGNKNLRRGGGGGDIIVVVDAVDKYGGGGKRVKEGGWNDSNECERAKAICLYLAHWEKSGTHIR